MAWFGLKINAHRRKAGWRPTTGIRSRGSCRDLPPMANRSSVRSSEVSLGIGRVIMSVNGLLFLIDGDGAFFLRLLPGRFCEVRVFQLESVKFACALDEEAICGVKRGWARVALEALFRRARVLRLTLLGRIGGGFSDRRFGRFAWLAFAATAAPRALSAPPVNPRLRQFSSRAGVGCDRSCYALAGIDSVAGKTGLETTICRTSPDIATDGRMIS